MVAVVMMVAEGNNGSSVVQYAMKSRGGLGRRLDSGMVVAEDSSGS